MKKIITLGFIFLCMGLSAQQVIEIPVWPKGAPESNELTGPELTPEEGRIENVSVASFKIYPADKTKNTGIAILICPGGGYSRHAAFHEGTQFAEWYAENGITGIVMKYRLPNGHSGVPLSDVQEAMRIIRSRAAEWGINPAKIGVSGFSAGGHLASTLLTHFDQESRPDFGILFYPVITMDETFTHMGSRLNLLGKTPDAGLVELYSNEKQIKEDTPPVLLLLSDDDKAVVPKNSTLFYNGLKEKDIPAAIYVFPEGGHGWGFRDNFHYHEQVKNLVLNWIRGNQALFEK